MRVVVANGVVRARAVAGICLHHFSRRGAQANDGCRMAREYGTLKTHPPIIAVARISVGFTVPNPRAGMFVRNRPSFTIPQCERHPRGEWTHSHRLVARTLPTYQLSGTALSLVAAKEGVEVIQVVDGRVLVGANDGLYDLIGTALNPLSSDPIRLYDLDETALKSLSADMQLGSIYSMRLHDAGRILISTEAVSKVAPTTALENSS